MSTKETKESNILDTVRDGKYLSRRNFLKISGAATLSAAFIASCKKDDDDPDPTVTDNGVDLGSGDTGILNYAYALEQLEAAFYTQVVASPYTGMSAEETQIMYDLKSHEIAHRDFFKAALGSKAIQDLEVDFTTVDFGSRKSVLETAKAFEDLGVSAYNGAGRLISDPQYLVLAGKIVSVEARHAAAIRDLIEPKTAAFAGDDVVNANGLDVARTPSEVLAMAGKYIKTKINASNLPK